MARLEAQGVETRGDLDRVLTEQAEVLIQVRDVGWLSLCLLVLLVCSESQARLSDVKCLMILTFWQVEALKEENEGLREQLREAIGRCAHAYDDGIPMMEGIKTAATRRKPTTSTCPTIT